jgi:hypothetical protein
MFSTRVSRILKKNLRDRLLIAPAYPAAAA